MKLKSKSRQKAIAGIAAAIVMILCFGITTYALLTVSVSVKDHAFQTGTVAINLNDGKKVIEKDEYCFEPGMTVKKDFFIENTGTGDAYYKVYFENISGQLAEVLEVTVQKEDTVISKGILAELTLENAESPDDLLAANERKEFTVSFYFPEEAGNQITGTDVTFDLCALAVQSKNNPSRLFE